MNPVLARWNSLGPADRRPRGPSLLRLAGVGSGDCLARRPIADEDYLLVTRSSSGLGLPEEAWQEAFDSHPPYRPKPGDSSR